MRLMWGIILVLIGLAPTSLIAAFSMIQFNAGPQCLNFVAQGDSITVGTGSFNPYPANIATALSVTGSNKGVASAGWNVNPGGGNLIDRAPTDVDPFLTSGACSGVAPYLVGFAGTNDIAIGGSNAAQTYAFFQTWLNARIAAGWPAKNIIVPTMISRTAVTDSVRVGYNNLLIGGATAGYVIANTGTDANLGCNGCWSNSTYFQIDGIHPTDTGQQILANLICTAIAPRVGTCPSY